MVNLISVLIAPYMILAPLNNCIAVRYGFFKISDDVLFMLASAFVCFFAGSFPILISSSRRAAEEDNERKLRSYDVGRMNAVIYIVGIIALAKLAYLYSQGVFSAENIFEAEGVMGNGVVGHMLLASYSVLPIVFLYWTYNRKIKYLAGILLVIVASFSTLIKYNVIGVFVTVFIFTAIYRKSILKKAVAALVALTVGAFVGNYALTFFISGDLPSTAFYLGHLYMYMAGSMIFDNYIFADGIRVGVDIWYKLMTFLFALPNMFTNKIFGVTFYPHERQLPAAVSSFGERSNVVDAIGYLYPSFGGAAEFVIFCLVMLLLGAFFSLVYRISVNDDGRYSVFAASFLCYFVFFSFFGTFYIGSGPWEILAYSAILPNLFYKRKGRAKCLARD